MLSFNGFKMCFHVSFHNIIFHNVHKMKKTKWNFSTFDFGRKAKKNCHFRALPNIYFLCGLLTKKSIIHMALKKKIAKVMESISGSKSGY